MINPNKIEFSKNVKILISRNFWFQVLKYAMKYFTSLDSSTMLLDI